MTHANEPVICRIEHGALIDCPVWEAHRRGRNWWAEISTDPRAPGGLARRFWERARGHYYYLVPDGLTPPVPVEVGADYYSSRGRRHPRRWYGVITQVTSSQLVLAPCSTAREAIKLARQLRDQQDELRRAIVVPDHPEDEELCRQNPENPAVTD